MSRWALPDYASLLLFALLVFTVWGFMFVETTDGGNGHGCDFRQFYTAGSLVNQGTADRLYDQPYFRGFQVSPAGVENKFYSLYPPMLALMLAPLARLPYDTALALWWAGQGVCFVAAGKILYHAMTFPRSWRRVALLALAGVFPLWLAVRIGHLTPVLLLLATGGLALHYRGKRLLAGLLFSILAIKPQFAAAIGLWLLLRRDWRAAAGMAIGMAAQTAAVSLCLGPAVLVDFLENLPEIARNAKSALFSPVFEQSFAGIVGNWLWHVGYDPRDYGNWFLLMQVAVAATAGFLLFRVVQASRQCAAASTEAVAHGAEGRRCEYAAVVLFMLLLTPYLLAYDLTLLAIPIVCLWSSPAWRMGTALYVSITLIAALTYLWIDFSLVPFLELLVLGRLAAATGRLRVGRGFALSGSPQPSPAFRSR